MENSVYSMWGTSFFLDVDERIPDFTGENIQYLAGFSR
jgi:hypothetical protein